MSYWAAAKLFELTVAAAAAAAAGTGKGAGTGAGCAHTSSVRPDTEDLHSSAVERHTCGGR